MLIQLLNYDNAGNAMLMDVLMLSHVTLDGCLACLRSRNDEEVTGHQLAVVMQLMRAAAVAAGAVAWRRKQRFQDCCHAEASS